MEDENKLNNPAASSSELDAPGERSGEPDSLVVSDTPSPPSAAEVRTVSMDLNTANRDDFNALLGEPASGLPKNINRPAYLRNLEPKDLPPFLSADRPGSYSSEPTSPSAAGASFIEKLKTRYTQPEAPPPQDQFSGGTENSLLTDEEMDTPVEPEDLSSLTDPPLDQIERTLSSGSEDPIGGIEFASRHPTLSTSIEAPAPEAPAPEAPAPEAPAPEAPAPEAPAPEAPAPEAPAPEVPAPEAPAPEAPAPEAPAPEAPAPEAPAPEAPAPEAPEIQPTPEQMLANSANEFVNSIDNLGLTVRDFQELRDRVNHLHEEHPDRIPGPVRAGIEMALNNRINNIPRREARLNAEANKLRAQEGLAAWDRNVARLKQIWRVSRVFLLFSVLGAGVGAGLGSIAGSAAGSGVLGGLAGWAAGGSIGAGAGVLGAALVPVFSRDFRQFNLDATKAEEKIAISQEKLGEIEDKRLNGSLNDLDVFSQTAAYISSRRLGLNSKKAQEAFRNRMDIGGLRGALGYA